MKNKLIRKEELKTLDDFCHLENGFYLLRKEIKKWIKYYQQQRDLHWEFMNSSSGENPTFNRLEGADFECCLIPDEYEGRIQLLRKIFNLET